MGFLRKASLSRPEDDAGKSWPAIAMGFFVAFGGVLFGYVSFRINFAMLCQCRLSRRQGTARLILHLAAMIPELSAAS